MNSGGAVTASSRKTWKSCRPPRRPSLRDPLGGESFVWPHRQRIYAIGRFTHRQELERKDSKQMYFGKELDTSPRFVHVPQCLKLRPHRPSLSHESSGRHLHVKSAGLSSVHASHRYQLSTKGCGTTSAWLSLASKKAKRHRTYNMSCASL